MQSDVEREQLWQRQILADITNKNVDTAYKDRLARMEPWKLVVTAFGAGAAYTAALVGLLVLYLK